MQSTRQPRHQDGEHRAAISRGTLGVVFELLAVHVELLELEKRPTEFDYPIAMRARGQTGACNLVGEVIPDSSHQV
jgi:hypothetical protein